MRVTYSHSLDQREPLTKIVSPEIIEEFIERLKFIDFLNWKRKYVDPDVLDGTQWEIEIIREGRNLKNMEIIAIQMSGKSFVKL